MNIENILENTGLTKNEIKVYLALFEIGQTTTGSIIKKTNIHTSKVYDALERLIKKGLVTYIIESKTKYFKAIDPKRLLDFLDEKKEKIEEEKKEIEKILPELYLLSKKEKDLTNVEIFKGWKGMETIYKTIREKMNKGETNYVFGASIGENTKMTQLFFNKHLEGLAQKQIKQKIIYDQNAKGNIQKSYEYKNLFEIKYIKHTTPAEINIWQDNVMIIILKKEPTVILIKDKEVSNSFQIYFNLMWATAQK